MERCTRNVGLMVDAATFELREGQAARGRKLLSKAKGVNAKEGRVWCGLVKAEIEGDTCDVGSVAIGGAACADKDAIKVLERTDPEEKPGKFFRR